MGRASRRRREHRQSGPIRRIDRPDGSKVLQITDPALAAQVAEQFAAQSAAFRAKFGRDPGPHDPVFFDPDADSPRPIPAVKLEAVTVTAMEDAGVPPEFIYAYQQTGLIVTEENRHVLDAEDLAEWNDAIDRYLRLHGAIDTDIDDFDPALLPLREQVQELLLSGIEETLAGDPHPAYQLALRLQCGLDSELFPSTVYLTLMQWLVEARERLDERCRAEAVDDGIELAGELFDEPTLRAARDAAGLLGATPLLSVGQLMERNPGDELLFGLWSLVCGLVRTEGRGHPEYLRTFGEDR